MTEEIKDLFKNLSPKERDVLTLILGLDDGRVRTPEEVGTLFGVDEGEIIKIAECGLAKIPVTDDDLKSLAEKAREELKNKKSERKPRKTLSDFDSELLNIKFFENNEKQP